MNLRKQWKRLEGPGNANSRDDGEGHLVPARKKATSQHQMTELALLATPHASIQDNRGVLHDVDALRDRANQIRGPQSGGVCFRRRGSTVFNAVDVRGGRKTRSSNIQIDVISTRMPQHAVRDRAQTTAFDRQIMSKQKRKDLPLPSPQNQNILAPPMKRFLVPS